VKYLKENPAKRNFVASNLVMDAIIDAWHCAM